MKVQNPITRLFHKIKEKHKERWEFLKKEVSLAKENPKGSGLAFFAQILNDISLFSFQKRKYVKKQLKKFNESFPKK